MNFKLLSTLFLALSFSISAHAKCGDQNFDFFSNNPFGLVSGLELVESCQGKDQYGSLHNLGIYQGSNNEVVILNLDQENNNDFFNALKLEIKVGEVYACAPTTTGTYEVRIQKLSGKKVMIVDSSEGLDAMKVNCK